eukprot:12929293-Prorocentrum_lima.AAC.1
MHGARTCTGGDVLPPHARDLLVANDAHHSHVLPIHVAARVHVLQHLRPALKSPSRIHPDTTPRPD